MVKDHKKKKARKKIKKKPVPKKPVYVKKAVEEDVPDWKETKESEDEPRLSFWKHLELLKKHIIRSVAAVIGVTIFCFLFGIRWYPIYGYAIPYPYPTITGNISTMVFNKLRADLVPPDVQIIMINPIEAIVTNLQIAIFIGILLGSVVIFREFGAFLAPALKTEEKRVIMKLSLPALALFVSGCMFSYFLITPFTFSFLYQFGSSMGIEKYLVVSDFIGFVMILVLGFGVIFELPLLMAAITMTGLVTPDFWKKHWRIAVVIMIIIAGVITPDTTGITQIIVVVPMIFLYVAGYAVSRRVYKGEE